MLTVFGRSQDNSAQGYFEKLEEVRFSLGEPPPSMALVRRSLSVDAPCTSRAAATSSNEETDTEATTGEISVTVRITSEDSTVSMGVNRTETGPIRTEAGPIRTEAGTRQSATWL